jgi:hypothetical protein
VGSFRSLVDLVWCYAANLDSSAIHCVLCVERHCHTNFLRGVHCVESNFHSNFLRAGSNFMRRVRLAAFSQASPHFSGVLLLVAPRARPPLAWVGRSGTGTVPPDALTISGCALRSGLRLMRRQPSIVKPSHSDANVELAFGAARCDNVSESRLLSGCLDW